jgi:hypothetical protein
LESFLTRGFALVSFAQVQAGYLSSRCLGHYSVKVGPSI